MLIAVASNFVSECSSLLFINQLHCLATQLHTYPTNDRNTGSALRQQTDFTVCLVQCSECCHFYTCGRKSSLADSLGRNCSWL